MLATTSPVPVVDSLKNEDESMSIFFVFLITKFSVAVQMILPALPPSPLATNSILFPSNLILPSLAIILMSPFFELTIIVQSVFLLSSPASTVKFPGPAKVVHPFL